MIQMVLFTIRTSIISFINLHMIVFGDLCIGDMLIKDLIHWEELPVALAPSEVYDRNGCFSGSAIVIDDKLVLIYTGHVEEGNVRTETQCMAVSHDGIHFEKYAGNPVIGEKHINGIADIADFRDPKIMKYDNHYYTVVASKTEGQIGDKFFCLSRIIASIGVLNQYY